MEQLTHYRGVPVPALAIKYWNTPYGHGFRLGVDARADLLPIEVVPGQVYADNDRRKHGRTVQVDRISADGQYAICTVLTNTDQAQQSLDQGGLEFQDMRGTVTAIKIRRFYPNARGYRLIREPGEDQ